MRPVRMVAFLFFSGWDGSSMPATESRQLRSSDRNSGLLQKAVTPASRASSSMSDQS